MRVRTLVLLAVSAMLVAAVSPVGAEEPPPPDPFGLFTEPLEASVAATQVSSSLAAATSGLVEWTDQFGTSTYDVVRGIGIDAVGNAFAVGSTLGTLVPGETSIGWLDGFVRKYDPDGTVVWTEQFGTTKGDHVFDGGVDAAGNVYVVGYTLGAFPGHTFSGGGPDGFVRKYDPNGNVLWTDQFGSGGDVILVSVGVDAVGNVYIGGYTTGALPGETSSGSWDAFVRKYDPNGNVLWTDQFGTDSDDRVYGVGVNAAGDAVYVTGWTKGALGGTHSGNYDAFVRRYDPDGTVVWTDQFGTASGDLMYSVGVDAAGNVYAAGSTSGTLPGQTSSGDVDGFVRKYDPNGNVLWTDQFGSNGIDWLIAVDVDTVGNVFVGGHTLGVLPGETSSGGWDAFVRKYDSAGVVQWTDQFGSSNNDRVELGCISGVDNVAYVCGSTWGSLPGETSSGGQDAFVRKYCGACPPFADVAGPYLVPVGGTVVFDGSASEDPEGQVLGYAWTVEDGTLSDATLATPTYSPNTAGIFDVELTVTDPDGLSGSASTSVVVYDPSGGFATGAGHINSPPGALVADPLVSGKAIFVFVSRYQKGATAPDGNTQFIFTAGDLRFTSDSYQWLVVTQGGTNAQFKGTGLINGDVAPGGGEYGFMIWAKDSDPDTFRIRIWWEDTNSVEHDVYDNGTGQPITAGRIAVHMGGR